jgi:hypothetical protein
MSVLHRIVLCIFASGGLFLSAQKSVGATAPETGVLMLPMNCQELLPDPTPFLSFFEAIGRSNVSKDRQFAKRVYRIISLREKFGEAPDRAREQNPVDLLIRRTLCFYREQKAPTTPVAFDDPGLVTFLKNGIGELEKKVTASLFDVELERQQRRAYERKMRSNQGLVEKIQDEADLEAERTFQKLATTAKKRVGTP